MLAFSRDIDVAAVNGRLELESRYKTSSELSGKDEKLVEAVIVAWKGYADQWCELALGEIAWSIANVEKKAGDKARKNEGSEDVEAQWLYNETGDGGTAGTCSGAGSVAEPQAVADGTADVAEAVQRIEYALRCI